MRKKKLLALALSAAMVLQPMTYAAAAEADANISQADTLTEGEEQNQNQDSTDTKENTSGTDSSKNGETNASSEKKEETTGQQSVAQQGTDAGLDGTEEEEDGVSVQGLDGENAGIMTGSLPEGMSASGYIPSDLDYNTPVYDGIATYSTIPAKYPENLTAITSKYPDNRDQNPYGTCWAFASIGLAEFDLINDGALEAQSDLSELQLVHFAYNYVTDPLGGTADDKSIYHKENTETSYLNAGGNFTMSSRRLNQWIGPVNESEVPYKIAENVYANGLADEYAYTKDVAHLENTYLINIKQNANDVKEQIMEHGAVGVMYQHHDISGDGMAWNESATRYAYYDTDAYGYGHAVMIVGWDDNFSKDEYTGASKPAHNGAWLVRNSWGMYCNYFWMYYDTVSLADTAWCFDFNANDGYDNNYQLDGGINTHYSTTYNRVANIYNVQEKSGVSTEKLKAVSLSFTHVAEVSYTIEIYTNLSDPTNPASGIKQEGATTKGTTKYAGVYTVPLQSEVTLTPGESFAVVVSTDKYAIDYEQVVSTCDPEDTKKLIWENVVGYDNKKSYYGYQSYGNNYKYNEWPWGNFCIKAFTSNVEPGRTHSIHYELNGGQNPSDNPETYVTGTGVIVLKAPTNKEGCVFDGWYTDSNFTTQITEIPADATQDYTLYAKWSSATGEKLYGYSLSLDGTIGLNFYMELPQELKDNSAAYMEFTLPDGTTSKVTVGESTKKDPYNVFTCKVAAKEMPVDIKARFVVGDKTGKTYSYSAKRYAEYILNHPENYKESVTNTVKAMLNYGAASQQVFNYDLNNLANANLAEKDKTIAAGNFAGHEYSVTEDQNTTGISYYGSSLSLESETVINDYFEIKSGHSIDEYSFYSIIGNGQEVALQPVKKELNGKEYYCVEVKNIQAKDLDQNVTVIVRMKNQAGDGGLKVQYNAFSYGIELNKLESRDEKVVNVMNALYWYWYNANQYAYGENK